jgi:hypothetical protein
MKANPSSNVTANNEQMDLLNKFVKLQTISVSPTVIATGFVRHIDGASFKTDGTPVDIIDLEEYGDRKSNILTAPSTTNPVAYYQGGSIYVDPATAVPFSFYYYGENVGAAKPLLVLKRSLETNVYDSTNSVQLVWPEYMYPRIIMMILKYLGISINDPSMIQNKLNEINDAA